MIDINTPAARAKLATLPDEMRDDIRKLAHMASELVTAGKMWSARDRGLNRGDAHRSAALCATVVDAALNAAIVAAFEPLTAPDQSSDVARILGGDV